MGESSRFRVSISLVAAYVVALQALLLPLSVAASAPVATALCTSVVHSGDAAPFGQSGCPCAGGCSVLCCTHALAVPASSVAAAGRACASTATPDIVLDAIIRPVTHRPQIPRAPPAA